MKTSITLFIVLILLWLCALLYFLKVFALPADLAGQLALPKTTSELGDSMNLIEGLFSSLAILLGLLAILMQGKELRSATLAQTQQVKLLDEQLTIQNKMNTIAAFQTRLQYLHYEITYLDQKIESLKAELNELKAFDADKKTLLHNMSDKLQRFRKDAEETARQLNKQLV